MSISKKITIVFNTDTAAQYFAPCEVEGVRITSLLSLETNFHEACGQLILESPLDEETLALLSKSLEVPVMTFSQILKGPYKGSALVHAIVVASQLRPSRKRE